jgi:hypothetical protein
MTHSLQARSDPSDPHHREVEFFDGAINKF